MVLNIFILDVFGFDVFYLLTFDDFAQPANKMETIDVRKSTATAEQQQSNSKR